jgi:hypothetical protein
MRREWIALFKHGTLVAAHGDVATPWNSGLLRAVHGCAGATLAL